MSELVALLGKELLFRFALGDVEADAAHEDRLALAIEFDFAAENNPPWGRDVVGDLALAVEFAAAGQGTGYRFAESVAVGGTKRLHELLEVDEARFRDAEHLASVGGSPQFIAVDAPGPKAEVGSANGHVDALMAFAEAACQVGRVHDVTTQLVAHGAKHGEKRQADQEWGAENSGGNQAGDGGAEHDEKSQGGADHERAPL